MFQSLPGFREFYPQDCAKKNHIFKIWSYSARKFGFLEFDAPILEPLELFTEKSGPEIVQQLFHFQDQGGRKVALRPELTPSLARLVGARANSLKKPIKWFSIAEAFRYERPQKGRLRSFYQLNVDLLGEESVHADAELITMLVQTLEAFGLDNKDVCIRLSDRTLWMRYLEAYGLDFQKACEVLSIIDKMGPTWTDEYTLKINNILQDKAGLFLEELPSLLQVKSIESLEHFFKHSQTSQKLETIQDRVNDWKTLIDTLHYLGVGDYIRIDFAIVRGLAYYTGFVFEAFEATGKGRALAGGGRYDDLVKKLGGPSLPAVGFAIGDVTLMDLLEEKKLIPDYIEKPDVYIVIGENSNEKAYALSLATYLRNNSYRVEYSLKQASFNKQIKDAYNSQAPWIAICGQEVNQNTFKAIQTATKQEWTLNRESFLELVTQ